MLINANIARCFVKKIEDIRNEIESTCAILSDLHEVPPDAKVECANVLRSFNQLSEGDISAIICIKNAAKKSCNLDPMPTQLVVDCLDQLLPIITTIVNCSLSQGVFPGEWKDALVKPLLKKAVLVRLIRI